MDNTPKVYDSIHVTILKIEQHIFCIFLTMFSRQADMIRIWKITLK